MNELEKTYNDVFVPSWKKSNAGEPPSFEQWKNNYFREWLGEYIHNKSYEWIAMLIRSYAQDTITDIPICYDMCTLNDYDFTDIYDHIDHNNFNIRHDVYWEDNGYISSGDYSDYVINYWDDDILDYTINDFNNHIRYVDIDLDEYEY